MFFLGKYDHRLHFTEERRRSETNVCSPVADHVWGAGPKHTALPRGLPSTWSHMVRLALKKEEQALGSSTTAQSPSSEWASVRRDTLGCVPSSLGSAWYQVGSSGLFCSLLDSWRGQEGAWRKHLLSSVWHRGQADLRVAIYFNLCHTQHPPSTHRTYLLLQNRSVVPTESPPPHLTSPLCPPFCRKDFTGLAAPAQDSPGHTSSGCSTLACGF